jgi:hypothetical protein
LRALLGHLFRSGHWRRAAPAHLTQRALRVWVLAAAAFMLLDVLLEQRGLHGAWPMLRLLTGTLLAYPVGAGLAEAVVRAPDPAQSP